MNKDVVRGLIGLSVLLSSQVLSKPLEPALSDAGIINEAQILYWLEKRGELSVQSTKEEKQAALKRFISKSLHHNHSPFSELELESEKKRREYRKSLKGIQKIQGAGSNKTVKVLAVLIDFPDLPYNNNRLSRGDTAMYYSSYPVSHYTGLLFSTTGYPGPSGQTLRSVHQYYQAVSGGTFFFTGEVKGWYTANQNAAYYGQNTGSSGNDANAPELIKEAVSDAVATMSAAELAEYDIEDPNDIDNDNNFDEPDGVIDHVMVFHSSIGEEAGGGVLGANAIWSHRFVVDQSTRGYKLPGTNKKLYGYTVQPIDAALGVTAHEFGHDLGLPDEYDTGSNLPGSPVGFWSIMASGSWAGGLPGSQPSGFSPYARSYLQEKFGGNWVKQKDISLQQITGNQIDALLHEAVNHDEVNQLSILIPNAPISFKSAYSGQYQYYSGEGNNLQNKLSFSLNLPPASNLTLRAKAHWNIEQNYDYVQFGINGLSIPGNHTVENNSTNQATNIITGRSSEISGAEGPDAWVELEFDISFFAGKQANFEFLYTTDSSTYGYGFVLDDIRILEDDNLIYSDDVEAPNKVDLDGFTRITNSVPGKDMRYLIQLRSHQGIDQGLEDEGYDPGVLIWLHNENQSNNRVKEHPGASLIGVVDADQVMIGSRNTNVQIRDAAFSLFDQSSYSGDNHLISNSNFSDADDYSAPNQPESGIVLPKIGLRIDITQQDENSQTASLRLSRIDNGSVNGLSVGINTQVSQGQVSFSSSISGGSGDYSHSWDFGNGKSSEEQSPLHTYTKSGVYNVSLTVKDSDGTTAIAKKRVSISIPGDEEEKSGSLGVAWLLLVLALFRRVKLYK
ncbi:immune inhibitor A domain-containing protein [Parashewanella tropica]|uniref:immune inhibitor A domain-containing protein n=1 Tax=Parashewanella tropica TaxID=2547970 RepID=UPI00105A6AAA|nr:immune inhibitor A domain-containing protein [Parashewanella tropica]